MRIAEDNRAASARRLVVGDDALSMASLRTAIELAAEENELSDEAAFDLKLAATEAVANALRHGDASGGVEVELTARGATVDVEIVSQGPFRIADGLDPERGRGLPLIVALADVTEFERGNEATRLRIRKRARRRPQPAFA